MQRHGGVLPVSRSVCHDRYFVIGMFLVLYVALSIAMAAGVYFACLNLFRKVLTP